MRRRTPCAAFCMLAIMSASLVMSSAAVTEEQAETAVLTEEAGDVVESETAAVTEESETSAVTEEPAASEADTADSEESGTTTAELVAVSTDLEGCWNQVAIVNPDYVTTGINIRSAADQNSEILGYLYEGCAVWVLEKGDMWTEFYSNGITGFVMNDYLLYGESAGALAYLYGAQGVRTEWAGVIAYASADGTSAEVAVLEAGKSFALLSDEGHWLQIQLDEVTIAYVSEEDVTRVTLFEPATPKDGDRVNLGGLAVTASETYYEEYEEYTGEDTYTSDSGYSYIEETNISQADYVPETSAQTEYVPETSAQTEYVPETSAQTEYVPETSAQTETTAPETSAQTETTAQETSAAESSDDDAIDAGDGGYYDADTDTYYDADGNVIQTTVTDSAQVENYSETYPSEDEMNQVYEETYTSAEESDQTYTEAASTEASAQATTDDTTLLAALIYCEAGNQSYDGMVAVGAVVMNRVYSSSFPNTISEVIYQSGQFTPASSGALASALANGVPSTCYEAAAAAISGENPVGNALYFNTTAGTGIQIGDHWFY